MITKLCLENIKCFQEQTVKLAPLTLLAGLNGAGKSTVIQSLLLLRQSFMQGTIKTEGLSLNGDLVFLGTGRDILNENAENENLSIKVEIDYIQDFTWIFQYDKSSDLLPIVSTNYNEEPISLFSEEFQYLSAERIGPRTYFNRSNYKVKQQKSLGINGEFTTHYLSVHQNEVIHNDLLLHPDGVSNTLKAQIDAWLSIISPGTKLVIGDHADMDIISLRYKFTSDRDVSNSFRATNVGFGLTYTLPVLVALLAAKPGSILLIENPEAHLHPKGQSMIGRLMALASLGGVQIITETHSDHVFNGIRLAVHDGSVSPENISINFFSKKELNGRTDYLVENLPINKNGRIEYWPEDFFDEWDKSLDQLLITSDDKG
ncbi:P-loop containing nucleoside triphosphate hydrolase [Paenibacillus sp. 32O-W]|uniref:AAA family ATPase n=1 Tax=Paenibacillus sp. 32O-W TaxID=1695218 RepID=UPI0007223914|nr:DUF3696 domain-containing protein [Paenibacillus sp. 32O-W]ALS25606.1 P-loop containing nucleoside triphosphate hydrolase [Paenibacillus sp. 32O-W]